MKTVKYLLAIAFATSLTAFAAAQSVTITERYTYDDAGRLTDVDVPGYYNASYVYDPAGNIIFFDMERTTSAEEPQPPADGFTLYPNPASHTVWLEWTDEKPLRMEVLDMQGKVLFTHEIPEAAKVLKIPVPHFSGTFLILIRSATNVYKRKLVMIYN